MNAPNAICQGPNDEVGLVLLRHRVKVVMRYAAELEPRFLLFPTLIT